MVDQLFVRYLKKGASKWGERLAYVQRENQRGRLSCYTYSRVVKGMALLDEINRLA